MILSLTAPRTFPAFRRVVVAVCAMAFLIVTIAHSLGHIEAKGSIDLAQAAVSSQISVDSADGSSVPSAAIIGEHCHGCTMVAVVEDAPVLTNTVRTPVFQMTHLAEINPHPPAAEYPPPIALI